MRNTKVFVFTAFLVAINYLAVYSQSLPVGTPGFEDFYRRAQLTGNVDSSVSFTVRPVYPYQIKITPNSSNPDSVALKTSLSYFTTLYNSRNNFFEVGLLPLSVQYQFNSHHPVDWNDGAMIPAKGSQTLISGGLFLKAGPLTVQLRPEIVNAQNAEFETMNQEQYSIFFARYYDIYNNIDLPVRFGTTAYRKILPGQSSVRLNYKALSVGVSTENLWWGPGIRNSLLMSNTAPGFKHITLNTTKPIKTPIGSFEGQIIGGRLETSGFAPIMPDYYNFGVNLNVPKPDDWRYLSGMVLTWQPKGVPGLFLGFDRASQSYGKNLSGLGDYLPFFSTSSKAGAPDKPLNGKDQLSSMFMRWFWREEQAEIYFQFARYNNSQNITQTVLNPNVSRAYVFGLRKMLWFNRSRNENLLLGVEVSQLQQNSIDKISKGDQFYVSQSLPAGYTHMGQMLGAGIGPGANSQTITASWVKGFKRIGIQLERYIHNNDFYYYVFTDSRDIRRHWVDLSFGISGEWDYKNFVFNARLQNVTAVNYQWFLKLNPGDPYMANGNDANNIQAVAGVTYKFNWRSNK